MIKIIWQIQKNQGAKKSPPKQASQKTALRHKIKELKSSANDIFSDADDQRTERCKNYHLTMIMPSAKSENFWQLTQNLCGSKDQLQLIEDNLTEKDLSRNWLFFIGETCVVKELYIS